jgi:hypothetical protein
MAKYEQIQNWVKDRYGFIPKTCYIAHVKEICGLPLRNAWNRQDPAKRENPCPPDKVESIKKAFENFRMI